MINSNSKVLFRADPTGVELVQWLIDPIVAILIWYVSVRVVGGHFREDDFVLCVLLFLLTFPGQRYERIDGGTIIDAVAHWAMVAGLLVLLGYATEYIYRFYPKGIMIWLAATPVAQLLVHGVMNGLFASFFRRNSEQEKVVVIGLNETGRRLVESLKQSDQHGMSLTGIFDDRGLERLGNELPCKHLGSLGHVAEYVKSQKVSRIYIALPMASQPRILKLLDDLRDTTASIYFVPDLFTFDLIQARLDRVGELPVVAVCETPFYGMNMILKRISDVVFSILILILISPIMAMVALAVKFDSKGPVLFKQRRYGLDGKEILVYKFRSMTVCEDGAAVVQAQKNDMRVTRVGAFIRKTSLDELPQFINVLEGKMSIVGPRPHAIAHNEQYRKLIKGYMVRHKVKPGITGWAQVNGYRGETETLDKMEKRIEYDLDYLRNWSLRLDVSIILRTALLVVRDRNAF
ncbi:undecaprenyl-phosphate glucose phosphotransferase [Chitinivorax sp. B]|uniref:undecaprenyl-phosphate glucose phosphotransferase n=1 Tax=Chitinivorax sp. B TaxID=2502235 RepID=UPI0010F82D6A|nr:undecaprenyl-phosphate glucose phosphotransferase [Chitinivorax sp. B]